MLDTIAPSTPAQCPLLGVSPIAPCCREFLQIELLHHEVGPVLEISNGGARPIGGLAGGRIAIAGRRDPFRGSLDVASTDRFFRIGEVNRTRAVKAPRPGVPAGHFNTRLPCANCLGEYVE